MITTCSNKLKNEDYGIFNGVNYANWFGNAVYREKLSKAGPYRFCSLKKDETSVAYQCYHKENVPDWDMPIGARTFQADNFDFWSRCAKARLAELRWLTGISSGWDTSIEANRKYWEYDLERVEEAKKGFRKAIQYRREYKYLSNPKDLAEKEWQLALFGFCNFLLHIQMQRLDTNFIGQMIDQLISPAYEAVDMYRLEQELFFIGERRKVKVVAAFVLEREQCMSTFVEMERAFSRPEAKYIADRLNIRHVLEAMIKRMDYYK